MQSFTSLASAGIFPSLLAIAGGLLLLLFSADRFVRGAAAVARHCNLPPLIVGMVIVGFGTSAPEMIVSALAALQGSSGLALGNAYGSNTVNIGLILGISALICPLAIRRVSWRADLPLLFLANGVSAMLIYDGGLSRTDALLLLALFAAIMIYTLRRTPGSDETAGETAAGEKPQWSVRRGIAWCAGGLLLLLASSHLLVMGAVQMATALGVNELVIGLTVVAVGTSLPELASSIAAARQGEDDLAVGNILGSNLFNTLAVVGIAGAIKPFAVPPKILSCDFPVMAALTFILYLCGRGSGDTPGILTRRAGGALLLLYCAYTVYLIAAA